MNKKRRPAFAGVLMALSLLFLYLSSVLPSGRLSVLALSGLVIAAVVIECGMKTACLAYIGATILGLFFLPDKTCAVLYGLFFGLYPLLKSLFERFSLRIWEILCKLGFVNAVAVAFYLLFRYAVGIVEFNWSFSIWVYFLLINVVFWAYDIVFSMLIAFYMKRIKRK